jgi:hypothetical protein
MCPGQWFSPGTLVSSTNKTDCHNIAKIMLKVALNTVILTPNPISLVVTNIAKVRVAINANNFNLYLKRLFLLT